MREGATVAIGDINLGAAPQTAAEIGAAAYAVAARRDQARLRSSEAVKARRGKARRASTS